jgi:hypothetical protein
MKSLLLFTTIAAVGIVIAYYVIVKNDAPART